MAALDDTRSEQARVDLEGQRPAGPVEGPDRKVRLGEVDEVGHAAHPPCADRTGAADLEHALRLAGHGPVGPAEGLAEALPQDELLRRIESTMWTPDYLPYRRI